MQREREKRERAIATSDRLSALVEEFRFPVVFRFEGIDVNATTIFRINVVRCHIERSAALSKAE